MDSAEAPLRPRPGLVAWLLFAPVGLWLVLFVVLPTGMLVALSFAEQRGLGALHFTWTTANFERAFQWTWMRVFLVSIGYALATTLICMAVGYPAGYFIGRAPRRLRNVLLTLVMIPFWTSFLVRTYAWIVLLAKEGLINSLLMASGLLAEPATLLYTPFASILGLVYNYLPFMILPIYTSAEKLDGAVIEAAYDLGAGPLRAFSNVIVPLTSPGIAAGALLVFVPSIAMFAITTLMGGGKDPTIGEVIYRQFTSGLNQPFGAALGVVLLALFLASLFLARFLRPSD
ncbi:MAG: ABC transporter permease [Terrimicrobiaceae bacterium]|nr:ABC transporter permease [Terrimicrobiaceae bacterium]